MPKVPEDDVNSLVLQKSKITKNIYVHKIKSLMKLQGDQINNEDIELSTFSLTKKIKKANSDGKLKSSSFNKNTVKLQKNRCSAKKARERKKLYVKLLQNRVQFLKRKLSEENEIEKQSSNYLKRMMAKTDRIEEECDFVDVDKYFWENSNPSPQQLTNKVHSQMNSHSGEIQDFFLPSFTIFNGKINQNIPSEKLYNSIIQQIDKFHQKASQLKETNNQLKKMIEEYHLIPQRPQNTQPSETNKNTKVKKMIESSLMKPWEEEGKKQKNIFMKTSETENAILSFEKYIRNDLF